MPQLKLFYDNTSMREEVKDFILNELRQLAVEKAFNGENTLGIKEASEAIERAFSSLKGLYAELERPQVKTSR